MKMIKILQLTTVAMFVLTVLGGLGILFFRRELLLDYRTLVQTLLPMFLAEVVPALIGTPLTEAVRNLTARKPDANPQ